jgi:hypothetical protein
MDMPIVAESVAAWEANTAFTRKAEARFEVRLKQEAPHATILEKDPDERAGALLVESPCTVRGRIAIVAWTVDAGAGVGRCGWARFDRVSRLRRRRVRQRPAIVCFPEERDVDLAPVAVTEMRRKRALALRPRGVPISDVRARIFGRQARGGAAHDILGERRHPVAAFAFAAPPVVGAKRSARAGKGYEAGGVRRVFFRPRLRLAGRAREEGQRHD